MPFTSEAVQLEVFTWHILDPTMGTLRLSVTMPVTTVPWAAEICGNAAISSSNGRRTSFLDDLFISSVPFQVFSDKGKILFPQGRRNRLFRAGLSGLPGRQIKIRKND
jgi:hypothetical protein